MSDSSDTAIAGGGTYGPSPRRSVPAETGRALMCERIEVKGENADQAYDADDKAPAAPQRNHD